LLARLVEADQWSPWVIGLGIQAEHILHTVDKVGVGTRRDTPFFLQPWLQFVFFNT
jgi:hypothetical protein